MEPFWNDLLERLSRKLSTPGFKTFVSSAKLVSFADGILTIAVPTQFLLSWVKERCAPVLQDIFNNELQQSILIEYTVNADFNFGISAEEEAPRLAPAGAAASPYSSTFNPGYTFDTFVVGNNNRFAHAAAVAVSEKPAAAYNPLFTCGGSGLGKTHLMHAIAQRALALHPGLKIVYVKAEDFVNETIDIIRENRQDRWNAFRSKFRTVDILMIDDVQFFMGKDRCQEEFFNAFNALYEAKKQIILNSDRPPKDLKNVEERLISRLSWGLVTDIQPPDLETRIAILQKKIEGDAKPIPVEVLEYIARQIPSNVRDLEGALTRLVANAALTDAPLTIEFAAETLKHFFIVNQEKYITISTIKQVVAESFKLDIEELSAKVRTKDIALARQIAMFLSKEMTSSALAKIGSNFGGRDHTTVLHACDKIREMLKTDPSILDLVTNLKKEILAR
ncbi:MAG: chromosomal replication initiator protein DnaA [Candidatus Margulisbacteria bacterium]|jgi:chromosomal replication initiator protein|nr:chromosomal replication initiator protein DnaA [Candidatus Margulisiibacteriota bacterium]